MKGPLSARQDAPAATGAAADAKFVVASARTGSPSGFDPEITASELALAQLRRLLAAWLMHEPGARLGHDPEALHQLRVTARRIDATLGLFKRQLPVALRHARRTAKSVLRTLGAARDLDVQLAELARHCLRLPEHERAAVEPLKARLEAERHRARARMVRALDSEPTRRWLETLTLASMQVGGSAGAVPDRAVLIMPERVRASLSQAQKVSSAAAQRVLDGGLSPGAQARQTAALCDRIRRHHVRPARTGGAQGAAAPAGPARRTSGCVHGRQSSGRARR